MIFPKNADKVAPLVGAWIEISADCHQFTSSLVAPLVGAWIEIIADSSFIFRVIGRSSRGSVD